MLDLWSSLGSICCVILWRCIFVIHRRLREADEPTRTGLIFSEPRQFRRYWELATDHNWPRVPVVVAYSAFLCGLTSCVGFAVLLLDHKLK
jgi:hypothetical protein